MTLLPDLFEFAYVPNWFDHLSSLAEMAMPEVWRFKRPLVPPKNSDTPILEKLMNYVFKKQVIDFNNFNYESDPEYADRIFYLRNEKACFNTGLYTKNYNEIWVFGQRISNGMRREIAFAESRGILVRYFSDTCQEVIKRGRG